MDINVVVLVGRLTKDADIRTANDKQVAKFTLAVNRMKKDEADFITCTAFGKTAEIVQKYTSKGSRVAIRGRVQTGSYEKDGRKIYTTDFIVDDLELLDSKKESGEKIDEGFMTATESALPF